MPPEAERFVQYIPTIADYIRRDRRPTRGELSLLRMFAPDAWRTLRTLTYEQIVEYASPYESHPEYGVYVALVKSEKGRSWITDVLGQIQKM